MPSAPAPPTSAAAVPAAAAPPETPSTYGSASGLRRSAWNATPAADSAAPTSAPRKTRGARADHRMSASSEPRSASARPSDTRSTPTTSETTMATVASASAASVTDATRAGVARAAFEIDIAHATYHALASERSRGGVAMVRSFFVAVQMMTRVPVRLAAPPTARELAVAAAWYPLVGAGIGAVAAAAHWAMVRAHLPALAPWAALAAAIVVTGAFHEDGLADSADGLFGGHDRARRLEIMRDSRVGTYGVVALVLVLGAQVAALGALPPPLAWRALVAAHALGRAAALPLTLMPYARAEGGLGASVAQRVPAAALAVALATGLVPLALLPWPLGLAAAGAAGLVALVAARRFARDLGGITGDTLGAVVKLAELSTYVAAAAWAARA